MWQSSPMGPFDGWPSGGGGFETFYGFIGGENNQWDPALYDGTTPVEPPATAEEGYHLTEDLADRAVSWVRQQKALMPDKPFFVYFAPGATHAPHHVPKEWADKYAGGVRRRLGRAAGAHVRPPEGARRHPGRSRAHRPARRDPGLGRHAGRAQAGAGPGDGGVRRLPRAHRPPRRPADRRHRGSRRPRRHDHLLHHRRQRRLRRRHVNGAFNEMANFNGMAALETPEFMLSKMDEFGSPSSYNHYCGRLGVGDEHPVPVDQADRLALGWHPQRHHRPLARTGSRSRAVCGRSSPT